MCDRTSSGIPRPLSAILITIWLLTACVLIQIVKGIIGHVWENFKYLYRAFTLGVGI